MMYQLIYDFLTSLGIERHVEFTSYLLMLFILILLCLIVRVFAKSVLVRVSARLIKKTKYVWDDILYQNKLFHRAANAVIPLLISLFLEGLPRNRVLLERAAGISMVIVLLMVFDSLINSADQIYRLYEVSKVRPLKSILQVVKTAGLIVGGIIIIAIFAGESPIVLLGGISAMTAVISFIFKDAILGFVAGIQLTANDMIQIGDWIELPKYLADGTVIDLSMTTVKVQNFDKTITSIPAYAMTSEAFINWRGMERSGSRRIKRALYLDAAGVRFCDDAMLTHFGKIDLLKEYMEQKLAEVEEYNQNQTADLSEPANKRRLTNVGTFRAYITAYLKAHPGIHQEMTMMVRQLKPEDKGLPLEIYAFANTTNWVDYEGIQADIFDHLYAVAPEFGLQIFQQPSGTDIRNISGEIRGFDEFHNC